MSQAPLGIDVLKKRITDRQIVPPVGKNIDEFAGWLEGYAKCQSDILDIITELYEEQKE